MDPQVLDVINNLINKPNSKRSQSVQKATKTSDNYLEVPTTRTRVRSLDETTTTTGTTPPSASKMSFVNFSFTKEEINEKSAAKNNEDAISPSIRIIVEDYGDSKHEYTSKL